MGIVEELFKQEEEKQINIKKEREKVERVIQQMEKILMLGGNESFKLFLEVVRRAYVEYENAANEAYDTNRAFEYRGRVKALKNVVEWETEIQSKLKTLRKQRDEILALTNKQAENLPEV